MQNITITAKDIESRGIYSPTGMTIDALAYAANEAISECLYEYDEGRPYEPYQFDYEDDLLANTKTDDGLLAIVKAVAPNLVPVRSSTTNLQAGAYMALSSPTEWAKLLESYTEALKADGVDSISKSFNEALEKEQRDYSEQLYKEWLHGDYRNYEGVIYLVGKYFTEDPDDCEYNEKDDEYTFALSDDFVHNSYCGEIIDGETSDCPHCKKIDVKYLLLNDINSSSLSRQAKDAKKREERQAERERLAKYKAEQQAEADKARKERLQSLKK